MSEKLRYFLFAFSFLSLSATPGTCGERVRIGDEVLIGKHLDLLADKRIGIICNHTSVLPNGTHIVDTLMHLGINVTTLFGPEHGIRGMAADGEKIEGSVDARSGLPVYSLYGKTKKPTAEMLANVDVLLFDIQDVGARFYTYASTMAYAMEAAAENQKKMIILDRPNPINGVDVEGPVLDTSLKSFVGMFPIPIRHGLTLGELANMIAGEKWIGKHSNAELIVIPMEQWEREMWFDETGLPWVAPSPNMKTLSTATVYPGMCLFEGTNITEGRGTPKPFEYIGAPWINGDTAASALNGLRISGVQFESIEFTPASDSVSAPNPKFKNEECGGVYIRILDRSKFRPVVTAMKMLSVIRELYGDTLQFRSASFDQLAGVPDARRILMSISVRSDSLASIVDSQQRRFEEMRNNYLLYK